MGLQRYRHDASLSSRQASGAIEVDAAGEALYLSTNTALRVITIRYITTSESDRTAQKFSTGGRLPKFTEISSGTWQASVPVNEGEQIQEQLFMTLSLFGFGIYL